MIELRNGAVSVATGYCSCDGANVKKVAFLASSHASSGQVASYAPRLRCTGTRRRTCGPRLTCAHGRIAAPKWPGSVLRSHL